MTTLLRRAPVGGITHDATDRAYRGGQFIPTDLWKAEKTKASEALPSLIAELDENLQFLRQSFELSASLERFKSASTGEERSRFESEVGPKIIPLTTIEARIKAMLRTAYSRSYMLGRRSGGNLMSAPESEKKEVERIVRDEYKYLRGFLGDMKQSRGRIAYEDRMAMYARAIRETFFRGFLMSDTRPSRQVKWVKGRTEHSCKDCGEYVKHGAWTVDEFIEKVLSKGHLPGSGTLSCHGIKCDCRLEDV